MYKKFTRFFCTPPGYIHKFLLVMKLTTILIIAAFLQVSAATYAQKVTYKSNKVTLEQMIKEIRKQTGYNVLASGNKIDKIPAKAVDFKDTPIQDVLQTFLAGQPLTFTLDGQTIVIKDKEQSNKTEKNLPPPSPITISGRVTDSLGTPLIGATIANKTSNKSTITDEKGEFSISGESGEKITVSFIGYNTYTITIANNTPFQAIVLHTSASKLNEVVVSTGYQQIAQERATGSFVQVDNQLLNRRVSTDVLSKLEGVVPGLLFNRNSNPANTASGVDISIQGYNTLFSDAQPLIVVDNFQYDGNIQNINPNDIESVTVLKDAAAASIWGAKSGNGVIVITTKRGRRNQNLQIDATANATILNKPNLFYNPNFISSPGFIAIEQNLFSQGYYDSALSSPNHLPVSPTVQILADQRSGKISAAEATSQINALKNIDIRNDLTKYFYQKGINQQYALNLKGGGNANDYFFSMGYDDGRDVMVGNKNNRLTLTSNVNFYPVKNLTVSAGFNYIQTNAHANSPINNIYTGGSYLHSIYPYAQLVDANGNALPIARDYSQVWVNDPTSQAGLLNWQFKPYDEIDLTDNYNRQIDNRLNFGLHYNILPGFGADVKYQYEKLQSNNQQYYDPNSYYARNLINQYTNLSGSPKYPIPVGGVYNWGDSYLSSNNIRGQLTFAHEWNSKHQINAIAGAEVNNAVTTSNIAATAYGYNNTNGTSQNVDFADYFVLNPSLNSAVIPNAQGFGKLTNRYIDYFSNASYIYDEKYIISASARIDRSNLFGVNVNQQANPLYSAGLAWNLSKESFYHVDLFPYLKLRATYGYNGNINRQATGVLTIQQLSGSYFYNTPFAVVSNPGNPELRWEKVRDINLGADFGSKNNIITGSFDYYFKKGIDLFAQSPLAPSTGLSSFFGNTANTQGRGLDIVLNIQPIKTSNFSWQTNFLLSHATNVVTKYNLKSSAALVLYNTADPSTINPVVGRPVFSIYSYRSGPLTHDTGDPQGYIDGKLSTDYSNIIKNASSVDSLYFNGSARPTTFGSFRNTWTYKQFSVSANVVYKLNYYFRRTSINYSALFQNWGGANKDYYNRWQQPGDENKTIVPSMPSSVTNLDPNRDTFYGYSQSLVDKGDHIRLQDITLDYNWKTAHILRKGFRNVHLFLYVNNIGILWRANHDGLDPDTYGSSLPLPRTYSLGIKTDLF